MALELSNAMSAFFSNEKARQTEFIEVLARHHLPMAPAEIVGTSYCTDVDMRCNGFSYLIGELKHEMGSKGAEPVLQSAVYYTSHLRQQKRLNCSLASFCISSVTVLLCCSNPYTKCYLQAPLLASLASHSQVVPTFKCLNNLYASTIITRTSSFEQ